MELRTNCKNCGAPLHYDKTDYGKTCVCKYCDTEYHIDLLGRVEEFKIKIEIMGQVREYYISEWSMHPLYDTFREINGALIHTKQIYKTELTLIEI